MSEWEQPFEDGTKGACWCCRHCVADYDDGGYICFFGRQRVCIRDVWVQDCKHDPPKFKCMKREDEPFMVKENGRIKRYECEERDNMW